MKYPLWIICLVLLLGCSDRNPPAPEDLINYFLSGTISGLTGDSIQLELQESSADPLVIRPSDPDAFTFEKQFRKDDQYTVIIKKYPSGQTCFLEKSTGTFNRADINSLVVKCEANLIQVHVSGLSAAGGGLILQNAGADDLAIPDNGQYSFSAALDYGATYNVSVSSQPTSQNQACFVPNTVNAGKVTFGTVANIYVLCEENPRVSGVARFKDVDKNEVVSEGDTLVVPFNVPITMAENGTPQIRLPVDGDTVGTDPVFATNDNELIITLGASPVLTIDNRFSTGNVIAGAPSGIDVIGGDLFHLHTEAAVYATTSQDIITDFVEVASTSGTELTMDIAIKDLDNDTDLDIVEGNVGQATIVRLNDGTPAGFADTDYTLGSARTTSIAIGDVDGDGTLDIVEGNTGGESNQIWLNAGTGTLFSAATQFDTSDTHSLALADENNNAVVDYIVAGNFGAANTKSIYGSSTAAIDNISNNTNKIALVDVNGNSLPDLIEINTEPHANRLLLNSGSGSFSTPTDTFGSGPSTSLATGDIDGVNGVDVIVGNYGRGNDVYYNNGDGTFTKTSQSLGNSATMALALFDMDGDGDLDLVEGNLGEANLVWLNDGNGLFTDSGLRIGDIYATHAIAVGKLDATNAVFIVEGNYAQANRIYRGLKP